MLDRHISYLWIESFYDFYIIELSVNSVKNFGNTSIYFSSVPLIAELMFAFAFISARFLKSVKYPYAIHAEVGG